MIYFVSGYSLGFVIVFCFVSLSFLFCFPHCVDITGSNGGAIFVANFGFSAYFLIFMLISDTSRNAGWYG